MAPLLARGPGAFVQGEGSATLAVLDGPSGEHALRASLAAEGAVFPPDSVRFQTRSFPRRPPLAPPHAGDFRLGGPDAPAGSGVGARPFPVPGSDGVRRWRPDDDAARRAPESDLDAHRPPLPLRVPFGSIEGDVGPGEPVRAMPGPRPSRALAPPNFPGLPAGPVPIPRVDRAVAVGDRFPMAVSPPPSLRPPSGPWGADVQVLLPPARADFPGGAPVAEPGEPMPAPAPQASSSLFRPMSDTLKAYQDSIRSLSPQAQGRVPKPDMPGAPGGQRGGRGTNIAGIAAVETPLEAQFEAAKREVERAQGEVDRDVSLGAFGEIDAGPPMTSEKDPATKARELAAAKEQLVAAKQALASADERAREHAGSQWLDRLQEEQGREFAAAEREAERELKKQETRTNYDQWKAGSDAMKGAQGARDAGNDVKAEAGQLRGKVDDATVANVRALGDDAKFWAKKAEKAGKKAKDAAKFGTKAEAEAAAANAKEVADLAAETAAAAKDALAAAQAEANGEESGADGKGGSGGGPPPSKPVPHILDTMHVCGNPIPGCDAVETRCKPQERRVCHYELVEEGAPKKKGGSKGKGIPQASEDSRGSTPDSNPTSTESAERRPLPPGGAEVPEATEPKAPDPPPEDPLKQETPPDAEPKLSDEVKRLLEEAEKVLKKLKSGIDDVDRRLEDLSNRNERLFGKVTQGLPLNRAERKGFDRIMGKMGVLVAAREKLGNLFEATRFLGLAGLETKGTERARVLGAVAAFGEFGSQVLRATDAAERRVDEANTGLDYGREDLSEAERLIRVARTLDTGHGVILEGQRKAIKEARDEIRALGLNPDRTGSVELAQLVNRKRLRAGMEAADAEVGRGTGFWGGLARGMHAFETALFELPVVALQAGVSRLLGNTATSDAQYRAADGAALDVWRLLSNQNTGEVRNRITQATLGTISLQATAAEEALGEEGWLAAARLEAKVLGPTIVTALSVAAGEGAMAAIGGRLGQLRNLASVRATVHGGEALLQRAGRFAIDTRTWKSISRAYHKARPGDYDLTHVFFDRRASATWLPGSIKNAGWNVLEMPDWVFRGMLRTPTGKTVNLNQWINLVKRSSQYSTSAKAGAYSLEWGIRGLVAVPAGEAAYIGKVYGDTYIWGDE